MCVKQVMHTKYLKYLPCYNVFKCVCTNVASAKGCTSCARECELENRFVGGTCNRQTYECQCKYADPLTDAQRSIFISGHNVRRTNLTRGFYTAADGKLPPASNIFKLTWNTDLALLARRLASVCVGWGDRDEIPNQGVNLFALRPLVGPVAAAKSAVGDWWSNVEWFYMGEGTGDFEVGQWYEQGEGNDCRYFTQMAWNIQSRFGCAVGSCKQAKRTVVACVYAMSVFQNPSAKLYTPGKPCSGCKGAGGTDRQCKPPNTFLCTET